MKKRKKVVKLRGSKTHGWGSKKKHRGGGSRGGRGMAGAAKHKRLLLWKQGRDIGKRGFKSLSQRDLKKGVKAINLKDIGKLMGKEKEIDLSKSGYDKVLATGNIVKGLTIKAKSFSKKAAEKIQKAGSKAVKV